MLTLQRYLKEQENYHDLIKAAFPFFNINKEKIEVADFSLTNPGFEIGQTVDPNSDIESASKTFNDIGLGVYMLENMAMDSLVDQGARKGYCSKILAWKPNQLLPDHRHQTVYINYCIIGKTEEVPEGLETLILLSKINPDFGPDHGELENYPLADFNYLVPDPKLPWTPALNQAAVNYAIKSGGTAIEGKMETFTVFFGDGYYIGQSVGHPDEEKLTDGHELWEIISAAQKPHIYAGEDRVVIRMRSGLSYTLPTNTSHSVIAGSNGMVAMETSTPSWDPADIFSSANVRRETRILMADHNIISQRQYFEDKGIKKIAG